LDCVVRFVEIDFGLCPAKYAAWLQLLMSTLRSLLIQFSQALFSPGQSPGRLRQRALRKILMPGASKKTGNWESVIQLAYFGAAQSSVSQDCGIEARTTMSTSLRYEQDLKASMHR
jgi:hypothetical protein